MQQESGKKSFSGDGHRFILRIILIILCHESDIIIIETDDTTVAYGDSMCILTKVSEYFVGTGKCFLGVNDPVCIIE